MRKRTNRLVQHTPGMIENPLKLSRRFVALKRVIRPTRGFQTMKTATATTEGFEVMRMIPPRTLPHV
jgi:hypothetical protein